MSYLPRPVLGLLVVVAALGLAGCASIEPDTANLPAASELVATAGNAMRAVTSAHYTIDVQGAPAGVPFQDAEGDLNIRGAAKGSAKISESGTFVDVKFVLLNGFFYVKGPTGGYQKTPVADAGNLFNPTVILNPNRGMAKVVASVGDATTQDKETVDGVDCYRITGHVVPGVLSQVVPGLGSGVGATLWLTVSGAHLPVKTEFTVPRTSGGKGATVDVSVSNLNVPITVTAPV